MKGAAARVGLACCQRRHCLPSSGRSLFTIPACIKLAVAAVPVCCAWMTGRVRCKGGVGGYGREALHRAQPRLVMAPR